MRQFVHKQHAVWHPPFNNTFGQICLHHRFVYIGPWLFHGNQNRPLIPFRMCYTDGTCLCNARTSNSNILQFNRANPLAAGLDDVLYAIRNLHGTVRMENRNVAGIKPLIGVNGVCLGLEIALDDPRAPNLQSTRCYAIPGRNIAVLVDDAQFNAKWRATLFANHVDLRVDCQLVPIWRWSAHCANWRRFGHAPSVGNAHTGLHKSLNHRPWRGRSTYCYKPQLSK